MSEPEGSESGDSSRGSDAENNDGQGRDETIENEYDGENEEITEEPAEAPDATEKPVQDEVESPPEVELEPSARPSKGSGGLNSDEVRKLLRRLSKSESSDSGESGSTSSFGDSIENRRSIKTLQSSVVRDHELPMKIAYEQLEELAANAEKVKSAIEKNRTLLDVQVRRSNSRYLRAAFTAWKLEIDWQKGKKREIVRANTSWKKNMMSRAFKAWSKEYLTLGKVKRLEKSALNIIQRHKMRRTWKAWVAQTKAKIREQEEHRREKRLMKDLDKKHQEKICRRACNFMYRWRLRRIFLAFRDGCEVSRQQGVREQGIVKHVIKQKLRRLFERWREVAEECADFRAFLQGRLRKRTLRRFYKTWYAVTGKERNTTTSVDEFYKKNAKNVVAIAFTAWADRLSERKAGEERLRRVSASLDKDLLRSAFYAFVDGCCESKRRGSVQMRAINRLQHWRMNKAFQAWICYMQVQAQKKMLRLQEHVVSVEKENDRIREENRRLSLVIDSGDWGRQRIAELLQAGQVLSGERDALTRLLGRMQRQHAFALDQQRNHEEEIQELKQQLVGNKYKARNKLLVKGASSFNSLVRAMKDDVLKNGSSPELLYTIDKLAMDEVTVFPDGDLHVKAVTNFDKGKGLWPSRHSSPGSNPQLGSSQVTAKPTGRTPTPRRKSVKANKPVKSQNSDLEALASQSSSLVSAQLPQTSPRYIRSRTPIRGKAFDKFNYAQKLRSSDPQAPARVQSGDREVIVRGYAKDIESPRRSPQQSTRPPTPLKNYTLSD